MPQLHVSAIAFELPPTKCPEESLAAHRTHLFVSLFTAVAVSVSSLLPPTSQVADLKAVIKIRESYRWRGVHSD